jgi:hypothetical protein
VKHQGTNSEAARAVARAGASIARHGEVRESARAHGRYDYLCTGPVEGRRAEYVVIRDAIMAIDASPWPSRLARAGSRRRLAAALASIPVEEKWRDSHHNVVTTEGGNAALNHYLKGSAYTAANFLGLIESTGYGFAGAQGSGVAVTNLMSSLTAAGGASPANGWNEATTAQCAARATPSFGTPSAKSVSLSSPTSHSILANGTTIKGGFLAIRSLAGTAPTSATGNTNGALYSAGLFTGGDKAVANGDTLSVSYTASI